VRLRFRPVDSTFYELFAESADHLVRGAGLLAEMLNLEADRPDVARRMREQEHAADETTHEIIRRVNSTFVTPFDREDIYALASGLDDVMDSMDEAVDFILLYEVKSIPPELSDMVDVIQRCSEVTAAAMPSLQAMKGLDTYWIEVNRLENQGDKIFRRTLANLFSGEYKAIEVLKLKDILTSLESAIDAFEKVSNVVETIAVKES
jgi:uncharacterized protein